MGPSAHREKRKKPGEFDPTNPPLVNPDSLMAASKGAAKEAQAEHVQLERVTEIAATQPSVEEGYTLDAGIAKAVKRLPGHLQPVVTLMATMVETRSTTSWRPRELSWRRPVLNLLLLRLRWLILRQEFQSTERTP